jgi:hypothetical protein
MGIEKIKAALEKETGAPGGRLEKEKVTGVHRVLVPSRIQDDMLRE